MIYIKKFLNHSDYESYINSDEAVLPNVSICEDDVYVNYNPIDNRLSATFNIPSTAERPAHILLAASAVSSIEIDGVEQPSVVTDYTFSTPGEHTVKYTLVDNTKVGREMFAGCDMVSVTIPNGITEISDGAFVGCGILSSITIPNSVTRIKAQAFQSCVSLTDCNIPDSVTSIGYWGFNRCESLTSITIPSGVTFIDGYAFYYCTNLENVTVLAATPPNAGAAIFGNNKENRKIYVPLESLETYKTAQIWNEYQNDIFPIN